MRNYLLSLFSALLLSSASYGQLAKPAAAIAKMEWLVGSWQGTYNNKPFYEAWRKLNDSALINFTIQINGSDTVVKENGVIMVRSSGTFYRGSDAQWKLSDLNDTAMVFVNDTLKYANRILWRHSKDDHWYTEIKNPKGTITYDIMRVPWLDRNVNAYMAMVESRRKKAN